MFLWFYGSMVLDSGEPEPMSTSEQMLQDQLLKSSEMQVEITELNRKNEQLQTVIEELQRVNDQFPTTNLDADVQMHDFKTKNTNLQKRNAKMQSTVADLIKKNNKMWSHVSDVHESISDLKTAVHEVKEDNSNLQSMISELHLRNEQLHSIIVELQANINPMEASVRDKLCKLVVAGTEDQELHLRILKLQEQNDQLKTMIMDLDKNQGCQGTLNLQMQDNVTQVKDIMEKLYKESKQMQTIISELDEKKYQLEVFVSALQENNFKLQAAIAHNGQLFAFSELQNNITEENLKLRHENWELQATISELCKSKQLLEASLSTLNENVCKREAAEFDNKKLQLMILELQAKSNEGTTTIIKLEDKNANLQKNYSDLQDYKNELLTIVSELQSKLLKLEGAELQNRQLQLLVKDLQGKNAQLNTKIYELAKKNNSLTEYFSQVQHNVTHHWIANVDLQEDARPQPVTVETKRRKHQFEASSSQLQAVLSILEISDTMKDRLQVSVSQVQESIFEAQDNILKLHGRINCLHKIVMELKKNSCHFSLNISELQDKIYKSDIRKSQNQHPRICQEKKNYSETKISTPELETLVASPITMLPASRESSLIQVILKVIMVSKKIKISIENIGIETKQLQASFFDLESRFSEIQLQKEGLLNTEECTLQEIVQQLKDYKCTLEKHEEEKVVLKQKIFELDKRLAEEKSFSNKVEAQIQNQQRVANSEISKLHQSRKDLLSSNMKLEETINWSLERNGVLDVKLAALKNILAEEEFQFSEKEAQVNHQWKVYINQVKSLQGMLSELFTENTDLKETIKILDQEKVQLQITVSELQSKLKSETLNVEIQQDDQLGAKSCSNSLQEKSKTMQKKYIKLIKGMEKLEVGKELPKNTMNKHIKENLCFDEKGTQIKSQKKTTDCDENNCPGTIIGELRDNTTKACESQNTVEKAETMVDHVYSEAKVKHRDELLCCFGNDTLDMTNQSTLAVFKNNHLLEMPNEMIENNKQLQAYIENLMEEKCLLTAMVSELEIKVREIQQHINESEVQKKNTFCEGIPTITDPQERECKQLLNHKNVVIFQDEEKLSLDAIVVELKKKIAREEFHSSELAVQMEIQKKEYDAEKEQLQKNIKDVQEKNEELKETVKKHEEEKNLLEIRLVEKENILSMEQIHGCEIQTQMKYQIQLLENQKCQLEDFVDLWDESGTEEVDVDKSVLQVTEDEIFSDLKEQHCFNEQVKNDVEPVGRDCETTKLQEEIKRLEERNSLYKLIVEGYRVENQSLTESLSKFKNLFKKQQMYLGESVADLTDQLKEANIKVQQLQGKLNVLTHNNMKLQKIINKSGGKIFFSQVSSVCNSEGQYSKSVPLETEHHIHNITNPDNSTAQPDICPESKKYLNLYVQTPEEKNDSKALDLKNIQQRETIKGLQDCSEKKQNKMESLEQEKKKLELNRTHFKKMLDVEQYTSNKMEVYLKSNNKILADQNNGLQEVIIDLPDDNTTFQVSNDNLEKEEKLLKFKIAELKDEMKMNRGCCTDKAMRKDLPKTIDLQGKLKGPENSNRNLQANIAELDRDIMLPEVVVSNFENKSGCRKYQLKEVDTENNHLHEAGQEFQDSNAKLQETMMNTENYNILLNETTGRLQDEVVEEHNFSIVLLKNSETEGPCSENICQQELKKNSPENLHLLIEGLAEGTLEFIDSQINNEPKEEKVYLNKNVVQPGSQKDFTWALQERKRMDVAVENLSGEISVPEVSILKLERSISEDQLHPPETERSTIFSTHQHKTINEAINNFQDIVTDRHQQIKQKKDVLAPALISIFDKKDLYSSKATSQCEIHWNSADIELRNNWLQGTVESLDNMEDLEIIQNVKMKKEAKLAADCKLQAKVEEEPSNAEKAASVCGDRTPVVHTEDIHQQGIAVSPLERIQEVNGVTLNNQEEKELQIVTPFDRETELSEEDLKDIGHINQRYVRIAT
ncbi:putative leucine-rich repeat-containing protein DDB_G0290503 [Heterodontus francisci]|uniref:putative leucine-rich repeat-containing protein DDB_G0290503 n=1 Tax=Heterodontus francisci TaxID=7792 RepID=UPI00355AFE24